MPPARRCPHGVKRALRATTGCENDLWLDKLGPVTWDPAARGGSDPMMPRGIGHIKLDGVKHLIYSADGPIGTVRWPAEGPGGSGGALLHIPGGTGGRIRALTAEEVWAVQGGTPNAWAERISSGETADTLLKDAARSLPIETARAVLGAVAEATQQGSGRAGGCHDPAEEAAWETTRRWLRAWASGTLSGPNKSVGNNRHAGAMSDEVHKARRKSQAVRFKAIEEDLVRGPEPPPDAEEVVLDQPGERAPKKRRKSPRTARKVESAALVKPLALGRARAALPMADHPILGGEDYGGWLEGQKREALMQRLSEGTRSGYETGWKQWQSFRSAQGESPWLEGRDREERHANEEALLSFVVVLARVLFRTEGTIKQKLFAVRYAHLVVGFPDPLLHRARLWSTLAGLRRWQGPGGRKRPVTPRMLLWLRDFLVDRSGLGAADIAVVWCAIMIAFFFMLRASEYLVQPGRTWSLERVIRGMDLAGRDAENAPCTSFRDAVEVTLHITSSKTDQYNVGNVRNQYSTGAALCPVEAISALEAHFPHRLKGSEKDQPLFRWASGEPIRREEIQHYLTVAGLAAGLAAGEIGSHSLRIGGATAMYHAVDDLQRVKRFGRWASDSFHGYLWESHEPMRGVSTEMATDTSELTAPPTQPPEEGRRAGRSSTPQWSGAALAAATLASTASGASGYETDAVAAAEGHQDGVALRWDTNANTVAIIIPLGTLFKAIIMTMVIGITFVGFVWALVMTRNTRLARWCRRAWEEKEPEEERVAHKAPKAPKQPRRIFCDAGVMGPVHYNGVRYVHATQGFRRADEVTREVASQGHGPPSFFYYPSAPPGGAQREPQKAHHE